MVVKSVDRACDRGNVRTGQRITDLQVALASAHLADVPPQRRRIVAKRVVHPFAYFMSRDRSVTNSGTEKTCGIKVNGEKVWIGEPIASWNPSTQHLFRLFGTPIDITTLYIKNTGNCEVLTPSAASSLSKTGNMVLMLTIPSGPQDPKSPDGIARASFAGNTR